MRPSGLRPLSSVSIWLEKMASKSSPPLEHWSTILTITDAPVPLLVTCINKHEPDFGYWASRDRSWLDLYWEWIYIYLQAFSLTMGTLQGRRRKSTHISSSIREVGWNPKWRSVQRPPPKVLPDVLQIIVIISFPHIGCLLSLTKAYNFQCHNNHYHNLSHTQTEYYKQWFWQDSKMKENSKEACIYKKLEGRYHKNVRYKWVIK